MNIKTLRLTIRDINVDDASDIFEYAKGGIVGPLAGFKPHKNIEETRSIINDVLKVNTFSIVLNSENKVVGLLSLSEVLPKVYELGYSLNDLYWNKGIMSEAVKAVIDYVFKNDYADELMAGCAIDNLKSEKVLLKAQFSYLGIKEKGFLNYDNKYRDTKRFRLLKKDYMEV